MRWSPPWARGHLGALEVPENPPMTARFFGVDWRAVDRAMMAVVNAAEREGAQYEIVEDRRKNLTNAQRKQYGFPEEFIGKQMQYKAVRVLNPSAELMSAVSGMNPGALVRMELS